MAKMVAASIVTYLTPSGQLSECLDSLRHELVEGVTVVDNSRDAATEKLCRGREGVSYVGNPNVGYGRGHNLAMERTLKEGIDYHLVVNADVRFEPRVIGGLVEFMERNRGVAMVQPRMFHPSGREIYAARMLPTPLDLLLRRFLPGGVMRGRRRRYELRHLDRERVQRVPYVQGSFMLIRSEALRSVGLFDPRYFMYPEDIDLSRRLDERFSVAYVPGERIEHDHAGASYRSVRMLWVHLVNMARYFCKWGWMFDGHRRRVNRLLRRGEYDFKEPVEWGAHDGKETNQS